MALCRCCQCSGARTSTSRCAAKPLHKRACHRVFICACLQASNVSAHLLSWPTRQVAFARPHWCIHTTPLPLPVTTMLQRVCATLQADRVAEWIMPEGARNFRQLAHNTCVEVLLYMSPTHAQYIVDSVATNLNTTYLRFLHRNPEYTGKVSVLAYSLGSVITYDLLAHQAIPERNAVSQALRRLLRKHAQAQARAAAAERSTAANSEPDDAAPEALPSLGAAAHGAADEAATEGENELASVSGASPPRAEASSQGASRRGAWRLWQRAARAVTAAGKEARASTADGADSAVADAAASQRGAEEADAESDALEGRTEVHALLEGPSSGRAAGSEHAAQVSSASEAGGAGTHSGTWSFRFPWFRGKQSAAADGARVEGPGDGTGDVAVAASGRASFDEDSLPLESSSFDGSVDDPTTPSQDRAEEHSASWSGQREHGAGKDVAGPVDATAQASEDARGSGLAGRDAGGAQTSNAGADAALEYATMAEEQDLGAAAQRALEQEPRDTSAAGADKARAPDAAGPSRDEATSDAASAAADSRQSQHATNTSVDADGAPPRDEAALRAALLRKREKDLQNQIDAVRNELQLQRSAASPAEALTPRAGPDDASGRTSRLHEADDVAEPGSGGVSDAAGHGRATSALHANLTRIQFQAEHGSDGSSASELVGSADRAGGDMGGDDDGGDLAQETQEMTRQLWPEIALAQLQSTSDITLPSRAIHYPVSSRASVANLPAGCMVLMGCMVLLTNM